MEARELRLGNLVLYKNTIQSVLSIDDDNVRIGADYNVDISDIQPIELTTDWLVSFGFEKVMVKDNYITYNNRKKRIGMYKNYSVMRGHGVSFNYVHQLQNLYFALTGEELELK